MLTSIIRDTRVALAAALAAALVGVLLAAACDGDGGGDQVTPTIEPSDIAAIAADITDDPASTSRIEQIIDLGSDAIPVLVDLANEDTEAERYTAIAALGRIATSRDATAADQESAAQVLTDRLQDPDRSLRTYAAGALTALGHAEGIPVLIQALTLQERGAFTEPPELLNDYAYRTLTAYIEDAPEYDPYADAESLEAGQRRWQDWWEANGDDLTWDDASHTFEVGE